MWGFGDDRRSEPPWIGEMLGKVHRLMVAVAMNASKMVRAGKAGIQPVIVGYPTHSMVLETGKLVGVFPLR